MNAVRIICSPVIFNRSPDKFIGDDGKVPVAVPDAFFRIVVVDADDADADGVDVLAFLIPMEGDDGSCRSTTDLTPYLTFLDIIEALTGLDFLTSVDDGEEATVEKVAHADVERIN